MAPAHGSLSLNGGVLTYTPNANYNGGDAFTFTASDGAFTSNTATVVIKVVAVNDAPVVSAGPATQTVLYSDSIQTVTITSSDVDTPFANLSAAFSYTKDGGAVTAGLPNGLTQGAWGPVTQINGRVLDAAGIYVISVKVSDGSAASTAGFTITVKREVAVAVPKLTNPVSMQVASAGGTASGTTSPVCFDTEVADGNPGDTSLINAATIQINAVGAGSASAITPSAVTFSGGGSGQTRTTCFTLKLANAAVNVYEVAFVIGGNYYAGTGTTAFTVFDPSAGYASGSGVIINPGTGNKANFGGTVKYLKNGTAQGSFLYVEHRPDGDYTVKANALDGLAVIPITGGNEAQLAGKATFGTKTLVTGNYSFIARIIDKGTGGTNDLLGFKLVNPSGLVVPDVNFDPVALVKGDNVVAKK